MNDLHTPSKIALDFQSLRAWRYNTNRVQMAAVLAPPYDVISSEKQQRLYEKSPFNCIRLILNRKEPTDTDQDNSYTRARDAFKEWQKKGVLIQDEVPCYYVYRQTFKDPVMGDRKNRYALLGRVRLESFDKGIVIPHEKTLRGPREDRMRLLKTVKTNFSPVFGLYQDEGYEIRSIIQDPINSRALFEVEDDDQITHALWIIHDEDILSRIHQCLKSKKVYIADGHHRYETALEYSRQKREEMKVSPKVILPFDYMYMALVSFDDPGFVVLPTHRIVTKLSMEDQEILDRLRECFKVEPTSVDELKKMTSSYDDEGRTFGLVLERESFLLTLLDKEKAKERMVKGKPSVWYDLNVNVLGHLILVELLGLSEARWESVLKFDHSANGAIQAVRQGQAQAAFMLQPPKVEMLEKMGSVNERMPQKSTYFYPKLASGLIFYSHQE